MSFDDAKQYLHNGACQSLELVCISGGEPCLYFDLVINIVREARVIGVPGIWVFTNAYWAVNRKRASCKLTRLEEAGLTRLCLSADSFHQPFIPVGRVRHAMTVARDMGLEVVLDVRYLGSPLEDNPSNQATRQVLGELGNLENIEIWQGQPWYIGRAADRLLSHLRQLLPGISQKVLTQQLRELVGDGIVDRHPKGAIPAPVEYSLTDYGRLLLPIVEDLRLWGRAHMVHMTSQTNAPMSDV
jgi:DNA-binding HxlR family transcriptional regulator